MKALLRFLRRAWLVLSASFVRKPRWDRCYVCGMYMRDGIATTAQPGPDDWVESVHRICAPCRHDILDTKGGAE